MLTPPSVDRTESRTPFPPAGPALRCDHANVRNRGFRGSGSPQCTALRSCRRRHEKPLRSSSLGRGPKSDRVTFRSEGSSASSARVDARRKAGGDAQSIVRSSVHSLLTFRFRTRGSRAKGRGFYAPRFRKSSALCEERCAPVLRFARRDPIPNRRQRARALSFVARCCRFAALLP